MIRPELKSFGWVALGGAIGAVFRHAANLGFDALLPNAELFTVTSFVNILGSFLMGYFITRIASKNQSKEKRLFLLTGLLGSFTTYSGFGLEAMALFGQSPLIFSAYIFSQLFMGILALVIGVKLAK
ncbi:fluoride efflux transporter FluC [Rhodohalobacter halophilus]|uniref:fluoride efflux transporter FluC n=1 Tax=Rhodohalobacter halophilus TaxID=1812810 RepID=UPI00159F1725|nr:CrcB family protein [Rhodohalobacter halophilus]